MRQCPEHKVLRGERIECVVELRLLKAQLHYTGAGVPIVVLPIM